MKKEIEWLKNQIFRIKEYGFEGYADILDNIVGSIEQYLNNPESKAAKRVVTNMIDSNKLLIKELQHLSNQSVSDELLKKAYTAGNSHAKMPEDCWETLDEEFNEWMRDNTAKEKKFTIIEILHELDECDHIDDARSYFLNYNPN